LALVQRSGGTESQHKWGDDTLGVVELAGIGETLDLERELEAVAAHAEHHGVQIQLLACLEVVLLDVHLAAAKLADALGQRFEPRVQRVDVVVQREAGARVGVDLLEPILNLVQWHLGVQGILSFLVLVEALLHLASEHLLRRSEDEVHLLGLFATHKGLQVFEGLLELAQ
jgi:hypothetical protein